MRTASPPPIIRETDEPTEHLWKNGPPIRSEPDTHMESQTEAGNRVVTRFDESMARANRARAQSGWAAVVSCRQEDGASIYYAPASHGDERTLALMIDPQVQAGATSHRAYIRRGYARTTVYAIPAGIAGTSHWLLQASCTELTTAVIDDLFLATFSDDADAARRLAPLSGFDLFVAPWS